MIIDTHSHCYWNTILPRIDEVIYSMKEHTISKAIQIGCDIFSSTSAIELSKKFPDFFLATIGIHPNECDKYDIPYIENMVQTLDTIMQENRKYIVGIGETGFDFHYPSENHEINKERQSYSWKLQADLAKKYDLPLVIHSRDAREETFSFIRDNKLTNIIMHCYSEDLTFAERILDIVPDVYFSFSGILTYPKATAIQETAKYIPLDRILLETDAPFLSPQPVRGTINEPANVGYVLEKLCELRNEPREMIERVIYENSRRIYGI